MFNFSVVYRPERRALSTSRLSGGWKEEGRAVAHGRGRQLSLPVFPVLAVSLERVGDNTTGAGNGRTDGRTDEP